jgi:poly(3-hydroxybutyrate) depolymerase
MRTNTLSLCFATILALLVSVFPSVAHHDDIPDPPPLAVSESLPTGLRLDPASVTVSGLSSGGFFAHQFHIAYSDRVSGAAILAGGPYGCVDIIDNPLRPTQKLDRTSAAVMACTHTLGDRFWGLRPSPPSAEEAAELIQDAHRAGDIADPAHLAGDRVWLFRGDLDPIIPEAVGQSLATLYRLLGIGDEDLRIEAGDLARTAGHGMPVAGLFGQSRLGLPACGMSAPPFLLECGVDAAELLFRHLYPDDFGETPVDAHEAGTLRAFDQSGVFDAASTAGLSAVGYIFVPDICLSGECRLHVAFHGCRQNADAQGRERIHDDFIRDAGYNRWAAANRIVVLYPQATEAVGNPRACWDFWGYSGDDWRTRQGVQMRATAALIDQLLSR